MDIRNKEIRNMYHRLLEVLSMMIIKLTKKMEQVRSWVITNLKVIKIP